MRNRVLSTAVASLLLFSGTAFAAVPHSSSMAPTQIQSQSDQAPAAEPNAISFIMKNDGPVSASNPAAGPMSKFHVYGLDDKAPINNGSNVDATSVACHSSDPQDCQDVVIQ